MENKFNQLTTEAIMYKRYEIQTINSETDGRNYRITDKHNDNRIATCYDKEHAAIICKALNYYENRNQLTTEAT